MGKAKSVEHSQYRPRKIADSYTYEDTFKMDNRQKLADLIAGVLEVDRAEIADDTGLQTHPKWDSMAHVSIIVAMESTFGVEVSEELMHCNNVAKLNDYLASHIS